MIILKVVLLTALVLLDLLLMGTVWSSAKEKKSKMDRAALYSIQIIYILNIIAIVWGWAV